MKLKYKIFENGTVKECLQQCLKEGYFPATLKQIYDLKESGEIKKQGYETSTVYFEGEIRTATLKELQNIGQFYKDQGRLLFLGDIDYVGLYGDYYLDYGGRFVGVLAKQSQKKKKKVKVNSR